MRPFRLLLLVFPVWALLLGVATQPARAADKTTTVAVLYFDYSGKSEEMEFLRKGLNQMLVSDLVGIPGVTIVERVRLEEVLAEIELNQTRQIDQRTAVRIGKLLGARYLVMGAYFDFQDTLHVSVKIVDVETGVIVAGVRDRKKVEEFWDLEQAIAKELAAVMRDKIAPKVPPAAEGGTKPATEQPRKRRQTGSSSGGQSAVAQGKPGPKATAKTAQDPKVAAAAKAPKAPKKIHAKVAARYGRALDAMDRGDKKSARTELEAVIKEQPDFEIASLDLASLAK